MKTERHSTVTEHIFAAEEKSNKRRRKTSLQEGSREKISYNGD